MPGLLGPNGNPIKSSQFKKAKPPTALGEAFANWGGPNASNLSSMPGGTVLQFNLNHLTLGDFRAMRDDYQINMSLSVLTFVMHQMDFHIKCESEKIATHCEDNLNRIWGQLVRGMSQAFWAGFSPNILQWENDIFSKTVQLTKVKDLVPERSEVNWKYVDGYKAPGHQTPQRVPVYDGIKNRSWANTGVSLNTATGVIPPDCTIWYPILMENGDYYGRKLLRACFQPWFFSNLIHLFANRYFERFGEPIPVGRAPMEDDITIDGTPKNARVAMLDMLRDLQARKAVVIPSDRSTVGDSNQTEFDYDIKYLENQMRGADFERYLTRLDEEKTLALFTPLLVTRTADVGSYNLGSAHLMTYNIMLNALCNDWKQYIDFFILSRMADYNFGKNAPRPEIVFRKLGRIEATTLQTMIQAVINSKMAKPDLVQLGEMAGLDFHQVQNLTEPPADPTDDTPAPDDDSLHAGPTNVGAEIKNRVAKQVSNAFSSGRWGEQLSLNLGFKRKLEEVLRESGHSSPTSSVARLYSRMDAWCKDCLSAPGVWDSPEHFTGVFDKALDAELEELVKN